MSSALAHVHLCATYRELNPLLKALGPVEIPKPQHSLVEAVVKTVVGQMLSGAAGEAIYGRIAAKTEQLGMPSLLCLSAAELQSCGLSARKQRTLLEFAQAYKTNPTEIERWPTLDIGDLRQEVSSMWGMTRWTCEMLAIFQFGHEDVFAETDGSIKRAVSQVERHYYLSGQQFDPARASPYRSYLSLYLWKSLDENYWSETHPP